MSIVLKSVRVSSKNGDFTSYPGRTAVAVVDLNELFTLEITVENTTPAPVAFADVEIKVSDTKAWGHTAHGILTHLPSGDSTLTGNITAPAASEITTATVAIRQIRGFTGPRAVRSTLGIDIAAGPGQIGFTTPSFTTQVGVPSTEVIVQTQNPLGQAKAPGSAVTISLTGPASGTFQDATGTPLTSVTVNPPGASAGFFYVDSVAGAPTIQASTTLGSLAASVSQTETVNQIGTSTALTANPTSPGIPATLTATVTANPPSSATPTGSVQFTVNGGPLGSSAPLNNKGVAALSPPSGTFQNPATYTVGANYPGDLDFGPSNAPSISYTVPPPKVAITGQVSTAVGHTGIGGVNIVAHDSQGNQIAIDTTDPNGNYSLSVPAGAQVSVVLPPSHPRIGLPTLYLSSPGMIYIGSATQQDLGPSHYELRTCEISGIVMQQSGKTQTPLPGVTVTLIDSNNPATVQNVVTGSQGRFCFNPSGTDYIVRVPATFAVGQNTLALAPLSGGTAANQIRVLVSADVPKQVPTLVYATQTSRVVGQLTDDKQKGLPGITVELYTDGAVKNATTDNIGFYSFENLSPSDAELLFPSPATDSGGSKWELQAGQQPSQKISIGAGQVVSALPVSYQTEQHSVEQRVLRDGRPAEGVLFDIRRAGSPFALQSARSDQNGVVKFIVPDSGLYELTCYPNPETSANPQRTAVQIASHAVAPTVNLPSSSGGGGGGGGPANGSRSAVDLQAYPVLTQDFSPANIPSGTGPAQTSTIGGTSSIGQMADRAIREVLSWRTKSDDPKGFMGALNSAFDLKEIEGHTEFTWTPRSYTVQTDLGAVTGAQASLYTRAKVALDQSMPLLDGLYALIPYVEPEDLATAQAVVRSQFTALVNEFGVVGGPRVPRVDELFELLFGEKGTPNNPEEVKRGSLGLVRKRFGLERRYVTTVNDETNLTNHLIMVDYVIGLKRSWEVDKNFFVRTTMGDTKRTPFFGTQLVLMSRALEVVAQGVQDAYYTMDSVFMGDAERQTSQLDFAGLTVTIPAAKGSGTETFTFDTNTSGLFVAELLDWVYRSASEELPALLQDAGKDGLESFKASTDRLRKLVHAAIAPSQNARGLPPGYFTPRVNRAMRLLADGLDEAFRLAFQVHDPDFPVELTPEELQQIRDSMARKAW